jgi:hypothetical protein
MSGLTLGDLAAKLVVEGCIAHVGGAVQGKMPMVPVPLTELERAEAGLQQGGRALFYPLPPAGVFLDVTGAVATVWYVGPESGAGLSALERALRSTYPGARQVSDGAHPQAGDRRLRVWEVDVGNRRVASVEAVYPAPGKAQDRFLVYVFGRERKK